MHDQTDSMFLATGSYWPGNNHVEIIKMNEKAGMQSVLTLEDTYPPTKLMWIPAGALGVQSRSRDLLATSSDVLHLYDLYKDESSPISPFKKQQVFLLRNEQEFSNPISSFDWNRNDPTKIAVSSVDSTVTILDINQQQLTTQIIAHDKAVFDVSFAPNGFTFASCGEDGSVRTFDVRDLKKSNIIYENTEKWLIRVSWSSNDNHTLALLG